MSADNFYNLDLSQFPSEFNVGDRVRVYVGIPGKGGSESWTTVLAVHTPETYIVDGEILRYAVRGRGNAGMAKALLEDRGWLFEVDGKLHLVAHISDLKSEAQGRMESHLYHMEEYDAGLL